ncbi:MAG TPA: diaminopimelate decarboxylase [Saprospiraceae bacterium]|jgi:diaminopimelate decarboxylase|nr:diaminopimelate decarboxylase [Saprospiraceae bacterium]MBK9742645.1 diaminopimelate decarboxylase [Saprospiraceae bacterium]HRG40802.1 diaminopimelate decarboxylase [Saprospiraceae bacterium]
MHFDNNGYVLEGGLDPLLLTEKYGCPLYIYETAIMKNQYDRLTKAFALPNLKINYACKALNNLAVLKFFKSLGAGLDTVSIQEVRLGLMAGFTPNEIIYTPNCVSIEEITNAVELGVRINIDNLSILEQFGSLFPQYPVCVRINPHIMAGGNSKISVGHIDSKFGISFHQTPLIHRIVKANSMKIEGIHMHTGSDILDIEVFLQGAEILFQVAEEFKDLEYIDFGSGFKVPYKEDDIQTDIEELGEKITARFTQFCSNYGKNLTLMFEPGKFLVSQAGTFLVKVNVVKQTTSTVFAGVDSGLNHLIRPMLYDSYHKIVNISKTEGRSRIYTIVGYICETDTFGVNRKLTEINEGDILAFYNAGAYCYTMSSNYNSRFRPAEVLIHDGQDYLIRRRETMEDLISNQVAVDIFD